MYSFVLIVIISVIVANIEIKVNIDVLLIMLIIFAPCLLDLYIAYNLWMNKISKYSVISITNIPAQDQMIKPMGDGKLDHIKPANMPKINVATYTNIANRTVNLDKAKDVP